MYLNARILPPSALHIRISSSRIIRGADVPLEKKNIVLAKVLNSYKLIVSFNQYSIFHTSALRISNIGATNPVAYCIHHAVSKVFSFHDII